MTSQNPLGQLSHLHDLLNQLLMSVPEYDACKTWHPGLASMAWYLGRSMFLETYWLREVVQGQPDMTDRVRPIFTPGELDLPDRQNRLPPRDHLLNWALELQEENLMRLANPKLLGEHPLLEEDRITHLILQGHAWCYEKMLAVLTQRRLQETANYLVHGPLSSMPPSFDLAEVSQGHYRIGARDEAAAPDNETPPQIVELSSFRIARQPATNGHWLAFAEAGGYDDRTLWSEQGWSWRQEAPSHPDHWKTDATGNWYGTGVNGPFDLAATEPVTGISRFEAGAFANWTSHQGGALSGAVIQHEYQWEVAARTRVIQEYGRCWEWCANIFQPYTGYSPPDGPEARTREFDNHHYSLRGASLHTQRPLRRASFRNRSLPEHRFGFSGTRLVFPPE